MCGLSRANVTRSRRSHYVLGLPPTRRAGDATRSRRSGALWGVQSMSRQVTPFARQEPEILRSLANARIEWVLNHPHMIDWLKAALRSAKGLDPVAILNDIEMLRHLITLRANAEIEIAVGQAQSSEGDMLSESD